MDLFLIYAYLAVYIILVILYVCVSIFGTKIMTLPSLGRYTIDVQGNIIMVDSHGPFNEDVVARYSEDIKEAITSFDGKPWGSLITYYGNGIFTPDAENALKDITRYRIENGMIAIAAVIKNSTHADLQQMQLHRIYEPTKIPFHVFSGDETAANWLQKYLSEHLMKLQQ